MGVFVMGEVVFLFVFVLAIVIWLVVDIDIIVGFIFKLANVFNVVF